MILKEKQGSGLPFNGTIWDLQPEKIIIFKSPLNALSNMVTNSICRYLSGLSGDLLKKIYCYVEKWDLDVTIRIYKFQFIYIFSNLG